MGAANAHELLSALNALGESRVIGHKDGEAILDRERNLALGTSQRVVRVGEHGLALRVEGATEEGQKCVGHG